MTERFIEEETSTKITSITPEFLPPKDKIKELYERLLSTQPGWSLLHDHNLIRPSKRGIKVTSSGWEDWIPAVHTLLGDEDFVSSRKPKKYLEGLVSKYSVMGTALHELSALTSLINFEKIHPNEISKAFPTYKELALLPYVDSLSDAYGLSLFDIWEKFRDHPGLMHLIDEEEKLIIKEFDIPFSDELQEEILIRRGPEVYEAGCKMIPFFLSQKHDGEDDRVYLETGTIFNWDKLSLKGDTRVQIVNRFDGIYSRRSGKGKAIQVFVDFLDLKTGRPQMDYVHCFQALNMHFMAGHFMDNIMRKGLCYRNKKGWYATKSERLVPYHTNYDFSHIYFDTATGAVTNIPVKIDYQSEEGQLFLEWVGFYSDAFNALRNQIEPYLRTGQLPEFSKNVYTQNELPLFHEDKTYQEEYENHHYYIDSTVSSNKPCRVCGRRPTHETCEFKTNLGGLKSRISIRQDCEQHFAFDYRTVNVDNRALVFPLKK